MLSGGTLSVRRASSALDTCLLCVWFLMWQSPDCLSQLQIEVRLRVIHYSKKMLGSCSQASSAKVTVPAAAPPPRPPPGHPPARARPPPPHPPPPMPGAPPPDMTIQHHVTCQSLARTHFAVDYIVQRLGGQYWFIQCGHEAWFASDGTIPCFCSCSALL